MQPLYFGGSFNPIHHGHLICARAVAEACGYGQIVLIPTGQAPHKPTTADIASGSDRLQMCVLATQDDSLFKVDDREIKRAGPSYSIDTAQELIRLQGGKPNWLIGADMLLYLPKWRRADDLLRDVHFVAMARPGWTLDWQALPGPFRALQANVIDAPMIDIRSTDIRQRVAAGRSIDYLTPKPVCDYIRQHGLYRETLPT